MPPHPLNSQVTICPYPLIADVAAPRHRCAGALASSPHQALRSNCRSRHPPLHILRLGRLLSSSSSCWGVIATLTIPAGIAASYIHTVEATDPLPSQEV